MNKLAQTSIPLYDGPGYRGFGPLGLEGVPAGQTGSTSAATFTAVLSTTIGLITIIAFIWFVFLLLTGGVALMTAGGDKGKLEAARSKLATGFVGLVVVVSAIFIAELVGEILGFDSLGIITNLIRIIP